MKKRNKIPTIIGFFVLVFGLAAGVFLVQSRQLFKTSASLDTTPSSVQISNVTDTSFTVTWLTSKETAAFVKLGQSASLDQTLTDEIANPSFTHSITVRNLTPGTSYFFKINSDGTDFDNNTTPWQAQTGPTLTGTSGFSVNASGTVLDQTSTPVEKALVFLNIGGGVTLSGVTSQNGTWVIPINGVRLSDLSGYLNVDPTQTLIEISVNAGPNGISTAQIYPQSVAAVSTMVLGQVHDFRNLAPANAGGVPFSSLEAPLETTQSSSFGVDDKISTPSAKKVTLDNIDNGEIVNTQDPEFFGKAPAGTTLTITVESDDPVTETVKASTTGTWNWDPPKDLTPGEHKITVKWKDASGIWQTITRTFVVSASEGPAFVATPSATLKATKTATPTATKKPTAKPSPTTAADVPESGSLTPTLILSIMGVGAIAMALLFWKKAEY